MFNLDVADNELAGAIAFYSIVNIPQENLFEAFKEIHRVMKPGGHFLISFHVGNEKKPLTRFLEQDAHIKALSISKRAYIMSTKK